MKNKVRDIVVILLGLVLIMIGIRKTYVKEYVNYISISIGVIVIVLSLFFLFKERKLK